MIFIERSLAIEKIFRVCSSGKKLSPRHYQLLELQIISREQCVVINMTLTSSKKQLKK